MSKDTAIHYVNFHPLTGTEQPRSIILIYITELSEVKLEVIMEVKGEVKGTIPHEQTASQAIVQPVSLA